MGLLLEMVGDGLLATRDGLLLGDGGMGLLLEMVGDELFVGE